jgi:hypothetical protein
MHSSVRHLGEAVGTPDRIRTDAQRRLTRFGVEWFGDQVPDIGAALGIAPLERAGLREAAEEVLVDVQVSLVALRGGEPLDARTANRLRNDRYHALLALIEVMPSQKHAKQLQLELTRGEPLAICSGDVCRIGTRHEQTVRTPFVARPVRFTVQGCNRIFLDAVTTVGEMWPNFCPDCARRKPVRDQKRALRRKIHTIARHPTIYATTGDTPETRIIERESGS